MRVAGRVVVLCVFVCLVACERTQRGVAVVQPTQNERVRSATIRIVGDVMQHLPQIEAARTTEGYDYAPCFAEVGEWLSDADLTIANLETTLRSEAPYSGYPRFAAPVELAGELAAVGVDVALLANNHICDRGGEGLRGTVEALDSVGVRHTGAYSDLVDYARNNPLMVNVGDFRVAIMNYTYGTNGLPIASGTYVNLLDTVRLAADMERAATADIRLVCLHWGEEYHARPAKAQRELADWLYRKGATVVVGGHPHVVQPVEVLADKWGRVRGVTFYSLGNYVSNQTAPGTDGGMVATLHFKQQGRGVLEISADWDFVWTHRGRQEGRRMYRVLPLEVARESVKDSTAWRVARFERGVSRFRTADTVIVGRGFVRLN